jgi:gliding motility-associated-like protein
MKLSLLLFAFISFHLFSQTGVDCVSAIPLCDKSPVNVPVFPANSNSISSTCGSSTLQNSIYYQFTVSVSGTLEFTVTPNGLAEFNWVLYDVSSSCPGIEVCCNFNTSTIIGSSTGISSTGPAPCGINGTASPINEFISTLSVSVGNTYVLAIDNASNNSVGFTLNWGGTFNNAIDANFTLSQTCGCAPLTVTINDASIGVQNYSWDYGNGNTSSNSSSSTQVYPLGTFTVSLVGTNDAGCSDTESQTVTAINPPTFTPPTNLPTTPLCPGVPIPALTVGLSGGGCGSSSPTAITWTNSNPSIGLPASGVGLTIPGFTPVNNTGAIITATITVQLTPIGPGCGPAPISFQISVYPTPPPPISTVLTYCIFFPGYFLPSTTTWTNSNPSLGLAASGTGSIPGFPLNGSGTMTITIVNFSSTGCPSPSGVLIINANPPVNLSLPASISVCAGTVVPPANITTSGPVFVSIMTWNNSNPSIGLPSSGPTFTPPSFTATNSSNVPISGTIFVNAIASGGCVASGSYTITVNPKPVINPVSSISVCANSVSSSIVFTSNIGAIYSWTNSNTSIGLGASGTGALPSFTAINSGTTPIVSTITVTPSLNGCVGNSITFTITVKPKPTITTSSNVTVCAGQSVNLPVFTSNLAGSTFNWTNTNATIGLAASGTGNIPIFTSLNNTTTTQIATISATANLNGCSSNPSNFTISVKPKPVLANVPSQSFCDGVNVPSVVFSSNIVGTTNSWTNSNTSIGLGVSGSGNLPAFTSSNASSSAVTSVITVTPTFNGCSGSNLVFSIIVQPSPVLNNIADTLFCAGDLVPGFVFSSIPVGTSTWTNTNSTIGLGSNGSGGLPSFTAINTAVNQQNSLITVTPTANGCVGSAIDFSIIIKPQPQLSPISNAAYCNGDIVPITTLNSSIPSATITWTNSTTSIGLSSNGIGNLPSFTVSNSGNQSDSASILVSSSFNGCTGNSLSFNFFVHPTHILSLISDSTFCAGNLSPSVVFSSSVSGTSFAWTNSNSTIGLALNGNGNLPSFTAINNGINSENALITVVPSANSCIGSAIDFTFTVNPIPQLPPVSSASFCEGEIVPFTSFNSSIPSATIIWTNSNNSIGLSSNGIGDLPSFIALNTDTISQTATILAVPSFNSCLGDTLNFSITVNALPTLTSLPAQTFCHNDLVPELVLNTIPVSSSLSWFNSNTSIGLGTNGVGNVPSFVAFNSDTLANNSTIIVVPTLNGCVGDTMNFNITINARPLLSATNNGPLCVGDNLIFNTLSNSGTNIQWTGPNSFSSIISNPQINNISPLNNGTYFVVGSLNGCIDSVQTSFSVLNTMNPSISIAQSTCLNSGVQVFTSSIPGGIWSGSGIIDSINGLFDPTLVGVGSYEIIYSINSNCIGESIDTIQVNPIPNISGLIPTVNGCAPISVQFPDVNSGNESVNWLFGNSESSQQITSFTHQFLTPGCFDISCLLVNDFGCENSLNLTDAICVFPNAEANFTLSQNQENVLNANFQFYNQSSNATNYIWNFGDGNSSTDFQPYYSYLNFQEDTFSIQLIANNEYNCPDTAYSTIRLYEDIYCYVPNSFTPDNDLINSFFGPVFSTDKIEDYSFEIYNRWGELIFQSNTLNEKWNGKYNDKECQDDIYVWKLKYRSVDKIDTKVITGHVSILR